MSYYCRFFQFFMTISLTLVICSTASLAEDFDEEVEEELADFYGDEDFVSIATGSKQLIHKAPSVASVFTADDIKNMGATDIDDVLEAVPGLHVSRISNGYLPVYTFRGVYSTFNPQVLMLINGIPITNMFVGNRSQIWGGMPVKAVERIEVIRGPGSAIYGAEAFAGVINVITKNADNIDGNQIGAGVGNFNSQDFWISYSGELGDIKTSLVLESHHSDGDDSVIEADAQTVLDTLFGTNASLAPGKVNNKRDNIDLRIDLAYQNWRLRGGFQGRNTGTGVGIAEALDPTSRQSSNRWNVDLTYSNNSLGESGDWKIEATTSYFDTTQEIDNNYIIFPPGSDIGFGAPFPDGVIGNPEVFERHFRFNSILTYNGMARHKPVIGIGYNYSDLYKVKESKNFAFGPNGEFLVPGSDVVDVSDSPFVFTKEGARRNKYLYLQDIWTFANDWELTTGIRYDNYSDFGTTINPRVALVWATTFNLTTKFLYGKAFRAPSIAETRNINNPVALGNSNLKPEKMETLELAFDYHPQTGLRTGVSFFTSDWSDIIQFVPDVGATTNTAQNVGEQSTYGVELEFDWQVLDELTLVGNYSIQNSTDKITDADAPNAPGQQIYLQLDWSLSQSWNAHTRINRVLDRKRSILDTRASVDDFTLVDLTIRWGTNDTSWEGAFIVKNIFDNDAKEPTPNINLPNDLPLAGRNLAIEINYNF